MALILVLLTFIEILLISRVKSTFLTLVIIFSPSFIYLVPTFSLYFGLEADSGFSPLNFTQENVENIVGSLFLPVILMQLGLLFGFFCKKPRIKMPKSNAFIYIFLIVGLLSFILYAKQLGGFEILFTTILQYRGGVEVVYTDYACLKTLAALNSCLYVVFLDYRLKTGRTVYTFLTIISFAFGFAGLFIQGGRLMIIIFLIPVFMWAYKKSKLVVVFALPVLISLLNPTRAIFGESLGSDRQGALNIEKVGSTLISELLPASANVYNLSKVGDYSWSYFSLVLTSYKSVIPKRLLGLGDYRGEQVILKELIHFPNAVDLISFGKLSLGNFGVFIWSLFFGIVISIFVKKIKCLIHSGFLYTAIMIIVYIAIRAMYFSPIHFILTFLPFIPLFLLRTDEK